MPDQLRTVTEVLARLPDNTSQLISPQDAREAFLCNLQDRANAAGVGGPWMVPLVGTDWAPLGPPVAPVMDEALWWVVDGNGAIRPAYPPAVVIVPPGHLRAAEMTAVVGCTATFTTPLELTFTIAGVPVGDIVSVDLSTQVVTALAALLHTEDLDYSDPTQAAGVSVRNPAGGGTVTIVSYEIRAAGSPIE